MVFSCFSCLCCKQNIADAPSEQTASSLTTRVQAVSSVVASNMQDTFDYEMSGPRRPPSLSPVISPGIFFAPPPADISDES